MPTQRPTPTSPRNVNRRVAHPPSAIRPGTMPTPASDFESSDALRSQLAQELHDELGSVLTAARLDVAWLKTHCNHSRTELTGRLQRLESLLKAGQVELRRMVQGLHPSALEQFGLPIAIESLARDFASRFEGDMTVEVSLQAQLDGPAALALYRCAQECLTNLHRHAGALNASLRLECTNDRIRLIITDDGCGFRPDRVGAGHEGIRGMRARLRAVQGHLRIESHTPAGTRIIASLPAPTRH